ncbi:ABC transporter permease [Echinicola shivajiensis]|uniref:ABC transporter permease n=1 Tax=Echinicola shivajiensis TaxID=1035916 RepID=UPI001BFC6F01|nr:ABC transporter permease [Echinicola shivajiensis]
MWKNYIKIAWRNLLKKKVYASINILGLAVGMACCLVISMYIMDELSYDQYHEKKDRIYRVIHGNSSEGYISEDGKAESYWVWGNAPVGPALMEEFPDIDKVVQFSGRSDLLLSYEEDAYQEEGVFFMDSTAFDVFSWEMIEGEPKKALVAPYSIVLTESLAKKYFGNEDPIGKTLKGSESAGRSNAGDYTVTGVMEDPPKNSHFKFNALLSLSTFRLSRPTVFDQWGYVDFYTYFLVNEHFNPEDFQQRVPEFLKRRRGDLGDRYTIALEPLDDAYLKSIALRQPGETGSMSNIYIFSVIGIFILVIAIINFMNLSTARSMERAKEVGIRKSVGANKMSLILQFMGESLIIVCIASVVGWLLLLLGFPMVESLTGKVLELNQIISWQNILLFLGLMVLIGLLAGSYPALVLSSFKPVMVLKGINRTNASGVNLRKALVIFQFSLSVALIAGTLIVYFQMNHLLDKDMGFDKEQMLVVDYNYDGQVNKVSSALKQELENYPSILSVAFSRSVPGSYYPHAGTNIESPEGEMKHYSPPIFQVGIDFVNHFDLELIAGRSYSRDFPSDSTSALIINEAAAKSFGYANPADIVGRKFEQWGHEGEVIGVVKDFNYISLHRDIEPLTLPFEAYAGRYMSVKVKPEDVGNTLAQVEKVWKELAPHRPFVYSFLDDDFNSQYQSDFRFKQLFTSFSVIAILIACLGLLGLATYTAEMRTKEIGIRKVLGAEVFSIVTLLSKDFVKLVLVAIAIATPVSWYVMNKWLMGFAYQIEIHWWIFAIAGLMAVTIAILTISFQSIKSALVNPVNSLRSE